MASAISPTTTPRFPPFSSKHAVSVSTKNLHMGSFTTRPSSVTASRSSNSLPLDRLASTDQELEASIDKPYRSHNAKLHKRGSSNGSNGGSFQTSHSLPYMRPSHSAVDDATAETEGSTTPYLSSKLRPYARRSSKHDQGKLDLDKSLNEGDKTLGLGINDHASRTYAADVVFAPSSRKAPHMRTTSGSSQLSTSSGIHRPNQPFAHPMKQSPRPYTPPTLSYADAHVEDDHGETSDTIDNDFYPSNGNTSFRQRRSISISSANQSQPTPLSQSFTPCDPTFAQKGLPSPNASALSLKSTLSQVQQRPPRMRRDTDRSTDYQTTPSSRTSFDKAMSFVSRRSESGNNANEPSRRDERIREARRKFEEKEARKDQKEEQKRERHRRQSAASSRAPTRDRLGSISQSVIDDSEHQPAATGRKHSIVHQTFPTRKDSLPIDRSRDGDDDVIREPIFERTKRTHKHGSEGKGWSKLSSWAKTKVLNRGK